MGRRGWTAALFGFAALTGLALQVRGALFPTFVTEFGVTEAQLGLIAPLGTLGYTVPVLLFGLRAGHIPVRKVLIVGTAGMGALLALVGMADSFLLLAGALAFRMVPTGMVRAYDRPVLSHLYPEQRGRVFNLQTMAWAVGAAAGPALVTVVLPRGSWSDVYFLLALGAVPLLLAFLWLDDPDLGAEEPLELSEVRALLKRPSVRTMVAALVLVVGAESTFFTWLPTYGATFLDRGTANLLLTAYLVAYIPGRYTFARAAGAVEPTRLVASAAALGAVAVAALQFVAGPLAFVPAVCIGFVVSGMFPTIVAYGTDAIPEHAGPVNAVAMTAGQAGFFLFPAFVGLLAAEIGIGSAMFVPVPLLAGLVLLLGR